MKKVLYLLLLMLPVIVHGQGYTLIGNNTLNQTTERYVQNSPTSTQGNRRVNERIKDSTYHKLMNNRISITSLGAGIDNGFPASILFSDDTGRIRKSPISHLFDSISVLYFDKSQSDARYFAAPAGTTAQYLRGDGTLATFPSLTSGTVTSVGITSADLASTGGPITSSGNINLDLNTSGITPGAYTKITFNNKGIATSGTALGSSDVTGALGFTPVPVSRSLTINGVNLDLTADQSWSVGDVSTAGSYANPSWITSLAPSKISYAGTTAQYVRGDGSIAAFPALTTGTVTSVGITSTDLASSGGPITSSGNITLNLNTSGISAGTYDVVTVNNKGITTAGSVVTNNPAVTRPVNSTTYTISSTQRARVYYTIRIACTASIGSASTGTVLFQFSTNGGTNWTDLAEVQNSNTVTLALILNAVTIQTGVIAGEVPANALCRMVSTSGGTTTITYVRGQEVLY